jgi:hypothetical protein
MPLDPRAADMSVGQAAASGLFRLGSACIISYFFVVVLMTATAQSRVAQRLAEVDPKGDYSSAYVLVQQGERARAQLQAAEGRAGALNERLATVKLEAAEAEESFAESESAVVAMVNRATRYCDMSGLPNANPSTLAAILSSLRQCQAEGNLPPALNQNVSTLLASEAGPLSAVAKFRRARGEVYAAQSAVDRLEKSIPQIREKYLAGQKFGPVFGELKVLRDSIFLGRGVLVAMPPALMQIVLSFASGTFGGLLLTLVLVVYPNNDLNLVKGEGYGTRILLGGLISVCVFVVLSGGTAVLGTSSAYSDGKANYLTFCAIGILAGMFADRVAHWLSANADNFFDSSRSDGDRQKPS